ncbi:DUF4430 domain-containing protein [Candidatus Shapirobacteria bacterium]|nr:DUF4430 domain-containing protein [Candidatus Shapirobacteria bacterium]
MNKTFKILPFLLIGLIGLFFLLNLGKASPTGPQTKVSITPSVTPAIDYDFSYKGSTGADALTLLKQQAKVEQDSSGLVTSINGQRADARNREYWAFYINGKLAEVGPAFFKTADSDIIGWRMERY